MVSGPAGTLLVTHADSARAIATVYTVSLLATLPLVAAIIAGFLFRRANASVRILVWRSAVVVLLLACLGRALPLHSMAWVVPPALATPLVALGRIQVTGESLATLRSLGGIHDSADVASSAVLLVRALFLLYIAGVVVVLIPTIVASFRLRRQVRESTRADDESWGLADVRRTLGIGRVVRVYLSPRTAVPVTWGFARPVVLLPCAATEWGREERRIVLLHELAHVRAADWLFNLAARLVCAVYWFHPGVWRVARGLREDCELACDDRVIAAGVRRSDYAELLVSAADLLRRPVLGESMALALTQRSGLRERIAAVLDTRRDIRPLARGWAVLAATTTIAVAGPMSAVRLAPTRAMLTTLMSDTRWESRAYAVLGLAQRQDSVAVARSAAELDPSPRVRAWARYALGEHPVAGLDVRAIIRD
jgi:beta-lactamase regulating signal transducer with metallopeptidase domain